MVDKDVLAKPYVVLTIMAVFFFLAMNLPRLFHPVPMNSVETIVFPDVTVSTEPLTSGVRLNITNNMNISVTIVSVITPGEKIVLERVLSPKNYTLIYIPCNTTCKPGIGYVVVAIGSHKYNILFPYSCEKT